MKRNRNLFLTPIILAVSIFGGNVAQVNHHWGNNTGMGNQGYSQLTQEQQATVQKLHSSYAVRTSTLRQQLQPKRCKCNALFTAQKPDGGKIGIVAQETEGLHRKLGQQRMKFGVALAEASVSRDVGMGYNDYRGSGDGHRGMSHW